MKYIIKTTIISFIVILVFGQCNMIYAKGPSKKSKSTQKDTTSFGEAIDQADNFLKQELDPNSSALNINKKELAETSGNIYNMLLAIGTVLTVAVGGVLGIKFMMASAEDKAKIKEMMIPYAIGCVVIYGAFGIWKLVVGLLNFI